MNSIQYHRDTDSCNEFELHRADVTVWNEIVMPPEHLDLSFLRFSDRVDFPRIPRCAGTSYTHFIRHDLSIKTESDTNTSSQSYLLNDTHTSSFLPVTGLKNLTGVRITRYNSLTGNGRPANQPT